MVHNLVLESPEKSKKKSRQITNDQLWEMPPMDVKTEVTDKPAVSNIEWDCEDGINVACYNFWEVENVNDVDVDEKISSLIEQYTVSELSSMLVFNASLAGISLTTLNFNKPRTKKKALPELKHILVILINTEKNIKMKISIVPKKITAK